MLRDKLSKSIESDEKRCLARTQRLNGEKEESTMLISVESVRVLLVWEELADFEQMSDGPQLTVEDLVRDGGFHEEQPQKAPVFHSFVLELMEPVNAAEANNEETRTSSSTSSNLSTR
ncbi:hypothetical protein RP20_CCG027787 [Aedes albopictus]|nr:hypothetical protein RP20_CCG027787 [Aedes albopictus]